MIAHTAFLGDANRTFRLDVPQLLELERVTGRGIGTLCADLFAGRFGLDDVRQTIRLALVGGGTDPKDAAALIETYVDAQPLALGYELAVAILDNRFSGPDVNAASSDADAATGDDEVTA